MNATPATAPAITPAAGAPGAAHPPWRAGAARRPSLRRRPRPPGRRPPETGAVVRHQRPGMVLALGVLPALPQPDPDSGETPAQLARRIGRPPSQLGFTTRVTPDNDKVTLGVEADFSFYVQRYPDRAEQAAARGSGATGNGGNGAPAGDGTDGVTSGGAGTEDGTPGTGGGAAGKPKAAPDHRPRRGVGALRHLHRPPPARPRPRLRRARLAHHPAGRQGPRRARPRAHRPEHRLPVPHRPAAAQRRDRRHRRGVLEGHPRARRRRAHPAAEPAGGRHPRRLAQDAQRHREGHRQSAQPHHRAAQGAAQEGRARPPPPRARPVQQQAALLRARRRPAARRLPPGPRGLPLRAPALGVGDRAQLRRPAHGHRRAPGRAHHHRDLAVLPPAAHGPQPRRGAAAAVLRARRPGLPYRPAPRRRRHGRLRGRLAARARSLAGPRHQASVHGRARRLPPPRRRRLSARHPLPAGRPAPGRRVPRRQRGVPHAPAPPGRPPITTWRLFQVVYQVIQLAGAARPRSLDDPRLAAELDTVDVLWFPTGGGKTEAYLGLIVVGLFYDRLRGKAARRDRDAALPAADALRPAAAAHPRRALVRRQLPREQLDAPARSSTAARYDGDQFLLGYWVGRGNTPELARRPTRRRRSDHIAWWTRAHRQRPRPGAETSASSPSARTPPAPGGDVAPARRRRRASGCGTSAAPAARTARLSSPTTRSTATCPRSSSARSTSSRTSAARTSSSASSPGRRTAAPSTATSPTTSRTWARRRGVPDADDRCLAGDLCKLAVDKYELVGATHDPVPALQVQDELHLLEEELGTFDAHYETLWRCCQRDLGTGKPTKLLAATATIEAYEEQVTQLYARARRVFPSPGWSSDESFYVTHRPDAARRLYVGALPYRTDAAEFGERVQALPARARSIRDACATPPTACRAARPTAWTPDATPPGSRRAAPLRAQPRLRQPQARRRRHRHRLARARVRRPRRDCRRRMCSSATSTSLAEIAEVLNRIDEQYADEPDRTKRLRALVAHHRSSPTASTSTR